MALLCQPVYIAVYKWKFMIYDTYIKRLTTKTKLFMQVDVEEEGKLSRNYLNFCMYLTSNVNVDFKTLYLAAARNITG